MIGEQRVRVRGGFGERSLTRGVARRVAAVVAVVATFETTGAMDGDAKTKTRFFREVNARRRRRGAGPPRMRHPPESEPLFAEQTSHVVFHSSPSHREDDAARRREEIGEAERRLEPISAGDVGREHELDESGAGG